MQNRTATVEVFEIDLPTSVVRSEDMTGFDAAAIDRCVAWLSGKFDPTAYGVRVVR